MLNVWLQDWSGMGPSRNLTQGPLPRGEQDRRVDSIFIADGEWS